MNSVNSGSNSALQAGLKGYQRASEGMSEAAAKLAQGKANNQANTHTMAAVELASSTLQATAAAEVLDSAAKRDSIIGSIIDTYA